MRVSQEKGSFDDRTRGRNQLAVRHYEQTHLEITHSGIITKSGLLLFRNALLSSSTYGRARL